MNGKSLLVLLILTCSVEAQELEFTGYYENQFSPQELDGKIILQDYNVSFAHLVERVWK